MGGDIILGTWPRRTVRHPNIAAPPVARPAGSPSSRRYPGDIPQAGIDRPEEEL